MIINKKMIFTAAIFGVTLFTVYKVTKSKTEEKYTEIPTPDHPNVEDFPEAEDKKEEIKNYISKVTKSIKRKVKKVLDFLYEHKQEIDIATSLISFVAGVLTLRRVSVNLLRDSIAMKTEQAKLDFELNRPVEYVNHTLPMIEVRPGDIVVGEWNDDNTLFTIANCTTEV